MELEVAGSHAWYADCDVSDRTAVKQALTTTVEGFSRLWWPEPPTA